MKEKLEPRYLKLAVMVFFLFAACAAVLVALLNLTAVTSAIRKFLSAISPLFYGLAFAFLLNPLMMRFEKLFLPRLEKGKLYKKPRKSTPATAARVLGITCTMIIAVAVIYALFAMIIPQLAESFMTIASNLSTYFTNLQDWSTTVFDDTPELAGIADNLFSKIYDYFGNWLSNDFLPFFTSLTSSVINVIYAVLDVVIGLIISVYVLARKNEFQSKSKKIVYSLFKVERANNIIEVARYADDVFGKFIIGKLIDSLIIGMLCFVAMSLLSLPFPLLISIIVGVTNIIPFFGPFLGAIPSAFIILVINPLQALYFIILIIVLQQFDGNILGPRILGDATGVSGFWVVVSILIFSALFGVIGMIIAVPTFAVISMLITRRLKTSLDRKGIDSKKDFRDVDHVDPETMEPVFRDTTPNS